MPRKVLLEASGTLVSSFMIKAVQLAGAKAIASDIQECAAQYLADDFIIFPKFKDPDLWKITEQHIDERKIDTVIPTLDETILEWSIRREYFLSKGVQVIVSDVQTVETFQDKWKTFLFFKENNIPTPESSLEHQYELIKPRLGRGGQGIERIVNLGTANMEGMISQELLVGTEYTIDTFCDYHGRPVYIVPRKRLAVKDGKSTGGITVKSQKIEEYVKKICQKISFRGPINLQCFELPGGEIKFTEINTRVGGGSALGFAATENWVSLIFSNIIDRKPVEPVDIQYNLKMYRYYNEVFI